MKSQTSYLSFEVQLSEGQKLDIPESINQQLEQSTLIAKIGALLDRDKGLEGKGLESPHG